MGVFIPVGEGLVKHIITVQGDTGEMMVTYGVSLDGGGSQGIVDALQTEWATRWDQDFRDTTTLVRTELSVGQDPGDPITFVSTNSPTQGTASGAGLPQNCALLIKKITGLGGRSHRGRMYIPGLLSETSTDHSGVLNTGSQAALQAIANAWLVGVNGISGVTNMRLFHESPLTDPDDITALSVDRLLATQRRRLRP